MAPVVRNPDQGQLPPCPEARLGGLLEAARRESVTAGCQEDSGDRYARGPGRAGLPNTQPATAAGRARPHSQLAARLTSTSRLF